MKLTKLNAQRSIYLLFAMSGFSGIIYESVWSQYLKLFLGHAAYAQALVLVIFMGGMALGAWATSRKTHTLDNPLLVYGLMEGGVGLFALIFDSLYRIISTYSFESIIPALGVPLYVQVYKIIIASLLILPPSVLLGSTFPLLTGGFIRKYPDAPGKTVSILYFVNSSGAAIALLFSTFYLIKTFGLPGTIFLAGILNISIAIVAYKLFKEPALLPIAASASFSQTRNRALILLAASFFTGTASFIYEVTWIRMLSMVLGSSTHSFELMLSAFIAGLAIGGYWIRKRIDSLRDPVAFAGIIQIVMGFFAFSTIFLYGYSFELMSFFMSALDETEQGYLLFTIAGHSIALLIMLPATVCAGMTLPLFTSILLRQGFGEKSIGQIYSINTIGAIAGTIFTVFIGMPALTLKGSILTGTVIDTATGLMLIKSCSTTSKSRQPMYAAALFLSLIFIAVFYYDFDPRQMASGVYRHGIAKLDNSSEILYHQDGETASITVSKQDDGVISITTNGKPDASISMNDNLPPSTDESTMTLLAALPLSIYPDAKNIANIGMGSGLTAHAALALPSVERVDTIEIEPAIIEGAGYFKPKTARAFLDPRSHIHIDDARTYFSLLQSKHDIIISEPSNPWVSGVSSLFTKEFYAAIKTHLNKDGLLVQWIHMYEFNIDLLVSVLKAISAEFPYYSIYFADDGNLILLARMDNPIGFPDESIFNFPGMKQQLSTIHINNIDDLKFRFLGDQSLYNSFLQHSDTPANSDYFPFLDSNAAKSRFMKENISGLLKLRISFVPVLDVIYEHQAYRTNRLSPTSYYPVQQAEDAYKLYDYFIDRTSYKETSMVSIDSLLLISNLDFLLSTTDSCLQEHDNAVWINALFRILSRTITYLAPGQLGSIVTAITPDCATGSLPGNISDWLVLSKAYSERNYARMLETTLKLLETKSSLTVDQARFLYGSLLAGLIKVGEHERAIKLWNDYIEDLYAADGNIPLETQILLGQRIEKNEIKDNRKSISTN